MDRFADESENGGLREKIVMVIRDARDNSLSDWHTTITIADYADKILDLLPDRKEWVRVEDRLPELPEEANGFYICLAYLNHGHVAMVRFNTKTKYFQAMNFNRESRVTHWQPLPQQPKEK